MLEHSQSEHLNQIIGGKFNRGEGIFGVHGLAQSTHRCDAENYPWKPPALTAARLSMSS